MKRSRLLLPLAILSLGIVMSSCKKEEEEPTPTPTPAMQTATYNYEFNNGQVVPSAAYSGMHSDDLSASITVDEVSSTQSMISVTVNNTVSGQTYNIHAHDAADPTTTPNGTPYNESPNANVFAQMAAGNGGSVTVTQTVTCWDPFPIRNAVRFSAYLRFIRRLKQSFNRPNKLWKITPRL